MESTTSIIELKAAAYDKIAMIENYQRAIQEVQKELAEVNNLIMEKGKEDGNKKEI